MWQEEDAEPDNGSGSSETAGTAADPAGTEEEERAAGMSVAVWKEKDILTDMSWEESAQRTGYLYQILVHLKDRNGQKVTLDDREVKVQVQGDGRLAGIDNGNLADVTPFGSESRRTYQGDLAVYVRRTGEGDVSIFLKLMLDGGRKETVSLTLKGK